MYKISLVFWRMAELGILLSIFTDLYNGPRMDPKYKSVQGGAIIVGFLR